MDLNQVSLIGRLTHEPELKKTQSGKSVCSFSIAVNDGFGDNKKSYFFNCECWNKTADFVVEYLLKGNRVAVGGKIKQEAWDDKEGKHRSSVKIIALSVQGLEPTNKKDGNQSENRPDTDIENPFSDSDIPF